LHESFLFLDQFSDMAFAKTGLDLRGPIGILEFHVGREFGRECSEFCSLPAISAGV
jgi:hypothetical protein